jgi:hypothetical protein
LGLYDETGNLTHSIEADGNGEGGYFEVLSESGNFSTGFRVDGNYNGTLDARVSIQGSGGSSYFFTDATGNGSVMLPGSAISAIEMYNEPGVASAQAAIQQSLATGVNTLDSRSINVPADGYVMVISSFVVKVQHTSGNSSFGWFGVSDVSGSFPSNQDVDVQIPSGAPSGLYSLPVTVHGLFSATAAGNPHTFYALGNESSGDDFDVADLQLTLVYLPTAYGTVSPTDPLARGTSSDDGPGQIGGLSEQEINAERAESVAFNNARIDRELAKMQAEIEALRDQLHEGNGNREER